MSEMAEGGHEEMKHSEQFRQILDDESYGIMVAPTDAQLAVNVLQEYLLGKDFWVTDPLSNGQVNTMIVHNILAKYSRKYRRECKRRVRQRKTD